jgi:hypothetical protein
MFDDSLIIIDRRDRKHGRMKLGSITGAIGGIVSGITGSSAAQNAANAQTTAAQNGMNTLNTANQAVQQQYQPYSTTGTNALNTLNSSLANGTGFAQSFNPSNYINTPGYQFQLQQGENAVNSSAAAKGNALSGGTLTALQNYGSGLANSTYNQAYQNYLAGTQQQYNQLSGLASLGLGATNQAANANLSTANGVSNLYTQQGNAQAAGIIGQQNALNGAITGVTGAANGYSLNNAYAKSPVNINGINL